MTQRHVDLKRRLIQEIDAIPAESLAEVLDFVEFLKTRRARHTAELAIASEPVLARDWLRPEEDEVWQDL